MALAVGVLDEDHLAGLYDAGLAVARGDLHAGIEVDDVLPARRGVPVEIVGRLHLAEDDAGRRQPLRQFAGRAFLDPVDLDVAEMRLALIVDVEIMDPHRGVSSLMVRRTLAANHRKAPDRIAASYTVAPGVRRRNSRAARSSRNSPAAARSSRGRRRRRAPARSRSPRRCRPR